MGSASGRRARRASRTATRTTCARLGSREFRASQRALTELEGRWSGGLSPVAAAAGRPGAPSSCSAARPRTRSSRCWTTAGRAFALRTGLDDATVRLGSRPERDLGARVRLPPGARARLRRRRRRALPRRRPDRCSGRAASTARGASPSGSSDVVAFARDLEVTYRVWSPKKGYPGGRWYRDFHTFDHAVGLPAGRA